MNAPNRISRYYTALAEPSGDSYCAIYSAPGLEPRYVTSYATPPEPREYATQSQAENAARVSLIGMLNARRKNAPKGRTDRYHKMTGDEFAVALAEANMTLTLFCHIYGAPVERGQKWLDNEDAVPHQVRVLLEIFKRFPQTIDVAESVTEAHSSERHPRG